jgi:hypothetical protein
MLVPERLLRQTSMVARESHRVGGAIVDLEPRPQYIHVTCHGTLATVADVATFNQLMEAAMLNHGVRRALLDVRGQTDEPSREVRAAAWKWLSSPTAFDQIAYVLPSEDELKATRINMTGVSAGVAIRSFHSVMEAHRWLVGPRRSGISQQLAAVRPTVAPSSRTDDDRISSPPNSFGQDDDEPPPSLSSRKL